VATYSPPGRVHEEPAQYPIEDDYDDEDDK